MPYMAGAETGKARKRREKLGWYDKYFKGKGLDIGAGGTPVTEDADTFDLMDGDGDAAHLSGVDPETYDFVYSSHLLEHMEDPQAVLQVWWRAVKPGGFLIVAVPDEDLYEQGMWPSGFNSDHRRTYTIHKDLSWSPNTTNLLELFSKLPNHKIWELRIEDAGYDYNLKYKDQNNASRQIECVVQKLDRQPHYVNTAVGQIKCLCGHMGLTILGVRADAKLMINCPNCGQNTTVGIWDLVKTYKFKPPKPKETDA